MAIFGLTEFVYKLTLTVARLFYLNILWLTGTLLGGVFLGVTPSSIAAIRLISLWADERSVPIGRTFFSIYRSSFGPANRVSMIFLPIIMIIVIVLWNLQFWHNPFQPFVIYGLFGLSLPLFNSLFFLLPTVAFNSESDGRRNISQAFKVSASSPHWFLIGSIGILLAMFVLFYSGFFIFFFASVAIWIINKTYWRVIENTKEEVEVALN